VFDVDADCLEGWKRELIEMAQTCSPVRYVAKQLAGELRAR
jgi:hypothetical protein